MRRVLIVVVLLVAGVIAFDFLLPRQAASAAVRLEHWRADLREARASVGGFEITYLEGGTGAPLVLLHGFGADKNNFTRVARYLTPHYRVVAPDLPGFGESSKPENVSYTVAEQVERVRAFTQQLGISPFHLGGSSMGGHIALAYAAKYPLDVASLWLLAPSGTRAAADSEVRRAFQARGEVMLVAKSAEEHAQLRALVMSRQPFLPHSFKVVLAERAAANHALHTRIFQQLNETPMFLEDYVTQLDVPALIVWGRDDRVLNPRGAETLQTLLPRAQVVLMAGIGHLPMIEAPKQAAADYRAFRDALAAR